jgi:hypothetical protein
VILSSRDEADPIQYSFDPLTRTFEFYADAETKLQQFSFLLNIFRQSGALVTQIPVTVNLFDKDSKFEYNAVPNQYFPVFEFGDRYN